jgi:hypothetical protein
MTHLAAPPGTVNPDRRHQLEIFNDLTPHPDPIIGLLVRPDDDCPCGEQTTVIEPAGEPHAGALVCRACGKHRGWLPRRVREFIISIIDQFGRPTEPIAYRRGPSSEGIITVKQFEKSNRGSLFRNTKKTDSDPDYSGSINIDGAEYWLTGWVRLSKSKSTKFLSLSVRPKEAKQPDKAAPFNDEIPL